MTRTLGLAHINLNVTDLERSTRFYQGVFGLAVLHDSVETIEKDGRQAIVHQVILTTPGARDLLALTQAAAGGLNHFGFVFASNVDVQAAIDAVVPCGGDVTRQGERDGYGVHAVFAYVRDPDGYAIELSTQAILLRLRRA